MTRRYSRFRPRIVSLRLFSSEFIPRPYGTNPLRQPLDQIAGVSVGSEPSSLCVPATSTYGALAWRSETLYPIFSDDLTGV